MIAASSPPLIEQPVVAVLALAIPHPLHAAHAHSGDLGGFDPRQLLRHRLQYHFLQFHHLRPRLLLLGFVLFGGGLFLGG
jgi:hypothetical protein